MLIKFISCIHSYPYDSLENQFYGYLWITLHQNCSVSSTHHQSEPRQTGRLGSGEHAGFRREGFPVTFRGWLGMFPRGFSGDFDVFSLYFLGILPKIDASLHEIFWEDLQRSKRFMGVLSVRQPWCCSFGLRISCRWCCDSNHFRNHAGICRVWS